MMPFRTFLRAAAAALVIGLSPASDAQTSFQGLWYRGEAESGWGVNVAQQGDILFVTWFTYDTDGTPMWLVGSNFNKTTGNTYTGTLFRTTGARFDDYSTAPFAFTTVGSGTLSFIDANNGTFTYTVNGITQSKPIVRQLFSTTPPNCTVGGTQGTTPNYSDLWWSGPSQNGWGVNLAHQGDILFATWFTYDTNGRGLWLVGPRIEKVNATTFSGPLYRVTGPAFNANPWNPSAANATPVGSGTFTFGDINNATFTYTVNGVTQAKNITRQSFATPATVCANPPTQEPPPPPPPPPPGDTQAPYVMATSPTANATEASVVGTVGATFSERMDASTVNASTFTLVGPSGPVAAIVTYSGLSATLTPNAQLAAGTQYTATISTGARDLAGNRLAQNHVFAFTTATGAPPPPASEAPRVVGTQPANTVANVQVFIPAITVTFSEPMDPASINTSTFTVTSPSGPVAGTVSYSGATASFAPSAWLMLETNYTATVTTGARDPSGAALASNYTFSFTTLPYEPPPAVAGCPTPGSDAQLRRLPWDATPVARMNPGVVAAFPLVQSRIGRASVAYTQGQTAASPPGATVDLRVSRCPGVIEDNLHAACKVTTSFTNFVSITAFNRPLSEQGFVTQEQHASLGCLAPSSAGPYYVNVRWTYPSCPFGDSVCGYSVQWGEGSY